MNVICNLSQAYRRWRERERRSRRVGVREGERGREGKIGRETKLLSYEFSMELDILCH